jgi:hypothetical protein
VADEKSWLLRYFSAVLDARLVSRSGLH